MRWILLSAILYSGANLAVAGGTVENGGDALVCRDENAPDLPPIGIPPGEQDNDKYFSLDYVYAIGGGSSPSDFSAIRSWDDSRDRLVKILSGVSRKLSRSFSTFSVSTQQIELLANSSASAYKREWRKQQAHTMFGTSNISGVPHNCLTLREQNGVVVKLLTYIRIVRRVERNSHRSIVYHYDPRILKKMTLDSPLQFSFMMVHEWLWDQTQDFKVSRAVNAFLHGLEIERMSPDQVRDRLAKLGLPI